MGNLIPTPTPLMVLGVDLAIQAVAWSVAAVLKTEKFYDLVGECVSAGFFYELWLTS